MKGDGRKRVTSGHNPNLFLIPFSSLSPLVEFKRREGFHSPPSPHPPARWMRGTTPARSSTWYKLQTSSFGAALASAAARSPTFGPSAMRCSKARLGLDSGEGEGHGKGC